MFGGSRVCVHRKCPKVVSELVVVADHKIGQACQDLALVWTAPDLLKINSRGNQQSNCKSMQATFDQVVSTARLNPQITTHDGFGALLNDHTNKKQLCICGLAGTRTLTCVCACVLNSETHV